MIRFRFEAEVLYWRGPSPFFFAPLPLTEAAEIRGLSRLVTYGWGMIPIEARIAGVVFATSLFPKEEIYLLPLKAAVRRATAITAGDRIDIGLTVGPAQ